MQPVIHGSGHAHMIWQDAYFTANLHLIEDMGGYVANLAVLLVHVGNDQVAERGLAPEIGDQAVAVIVYGRHCATIL